jgi:multiple sugar transport system substrate-binding protein
MRTPPTRRTTASAMLAVLALSATLTACGDDGGVSGGTEGDGTGTIGFWDNNAGVRSEIWKEIIADFEDEHPDIDVKYVGIPSDQAQSKYDTAIQAGAGSLPDVGAVSTSFLADLVAQGALDPIDDRLAESGITRRSSRSRRPG